MHDSNKSSIYNEISDFLVSIGFSAPDDNCPAFRRVVTVPGRVIMVNGNRMEEPGKEVNLDIMPLGPGAIINGDSPDTPLEGFGVAGNDLWVDSLNDFKFWMDLFSRGNSIIISE
jgi:hypothetical protein